ncbi:beta-propeller domain-containing protein [Actinophytocola sp.]|uniref:beta-propeller domain-containing protein n=1 Tax=Actinophytocola sp. TaxID=1872138 RepID=UPI002ECFCB5B
MKHDLRTWPRLALTAVVVVGLGAGVTTAAVIVGATDEEPAYSGDIRLVSYDTCDTALAELKDRILPNVSAYGLDPGGEFMAEGGAAAEENGGRMAVPDAAPAEGQVAAPTQAQPKDHSTTNVHEAGVDEPDLVKTDGKRVVSITDGVLRVVDVATRTQTAVVRLDGEQGGYATQMLLSGDRALVMVNTGLATDMPMTMPDVAVPRIAPTDAPGTVPPVPTDTFPFGSRLVLVDLTGAGQVLSTLSLDGGYLDARQVGAVARVVVRSTPRLQFRYPEHEGDTMSALADNRNTVTNSTIGDWLPRYELSTGGAVTSGLLTDCVDVSHPVDYNATAMLTVLTFDLGKDLGTGDPVTIVADGNTVYGTGTSLYVADDHMIHGIADTPTDTTNRTELYQFDTSGPGKPVHVASGSVDGSLLNQYSLSEHDGHLRVATTTGGQGGSQSMITVLARKEKELTKVGGVGGLGVGEQIYSVRYFGDTAYVVTFRQTDPLYTVDLSDPAAPKVTGELKITGYSAYLHPAGEGRLIGVGQEASSAGLVAGAQVSLFDTSNKAGATRIAQYHLPSSWTEVEGDPHAFLYWPDKGLVVLPISGGGAIDPNGTPEQSGGAVVLKLAGTGFEQLAVLSHSSEKYGMTLVPRRAIVIGNELWTVSEAGMMVNDLDSLAQLAWVPFP